MFGSDPRDSPCCPGVPGLNRSIAMPWLSPLPSGEHPEHCGVTLDLIVLCIEALHCSALHGCSAGSSSPLQSQSLAQAWGCAQSRQAGVWQWRGQAV